MRTNHTRRKVSWAMLALAVSIWSTVGLTQTPQPPAPAKTVQLVDVSDKVTEIAWDPGKSLGGAVLETSNRGFRLVVHLWRDDKSATYNEKQFWEKSVGNQPLQANDVVVLGVVDKERLRRLEAIPAIARALALQAGKTPGDKPSSGRQAQREINF